MIELTATPIEPEAAKAMMLNDATALLSNDIDCPLARKIIDALALLDIAIEAHRPD
ncbi:hypothetical protein [Sphingobium ummariense]|uniref:Uncharacterized protein n=1 Tax=Sphingobium ummariense RL-3 TaxID=1346791 RepID=T0J0K9_9SPHN|nr:hypothetical protein [Sphingobium ummariense]EQB30352.1 hypothetical protein M529_20375 [Sphingobium ummariense RL-3]